jgi:N-acetylmuramoyl-L-alanine amidase
MDLYRAIYHADPADLHAPAAVSAVAELLAEQGRVLRDAKSSKAAVGQYEFLRAQYPSSSLDVQALLAEGQIEEQDLDDRAAAKEKYKLLLKTHPRSEQAEEAQAGLASLAQVQGSRFEVRGKTATVQTGAAGSTNELDEVQAPVVAEQKPAAGGESSLPAMAQTSGAGGRSAGPAHRDTTAMNGAPSIAAPTRDDKTVTNGAPVALPVVARSGKRALVTGIRHWSTATYTRVAIDLGDSVTYEAARVPNPDRIYFDLHGSRLAQELVGKSFAVTDDGFLKKVRAAQYSDDVTRVVLDVNDVTEYSAFLLPNPYRLIIDIHGGKAQTATSKDADPTHRDNAAMNGAPGNSAATAAVVPAPHAAGVVKATAARPVPNAVATKSANAASEVADLSDLPGRVDATSKPTSKPISAVVPDQGSRSEVAQGSRFEVRGSSKDSASAQDAAAGMNETALPAGSAATSSAAPVPEPTSKRARKGTKAKAGMASDAVADATPARAATPMADGETSLVRALGLKIGRIVIDAGHGGHDSGTLGVDGIQEKDVVLDVALRLGKLLHDRLGAEIIYTRSDDTFIPLETRTAIANKAQADLFLSIHANSSPDASARGVETYYLNFTSDPTALDVAARENAVSDQSIHQLSDLVKKIALKDKIAESREFAADVEGSLYAGLEKGNAGLKDRGVKKAPFVVLIGANMPSILAEISFVTNPKDASELAEPEYRERVAESLYKGVARYEGGLSGGRVTTERAAVGQ